MSLTEFVQELLFEACMCLPQESKNVHWEAFRQLGGLKPRKDRTYKRRHVWVPKPSDGPRCKACNRFKITSNGKDYDSICLGCGHDHNNWPLIKP